MSVHVDVALPALVGPEAADVVLELGREVRAHAVEEAVVRAVAGEVGVGADEDVAVDVGGAGLSRWVSQILETV